jgi:hypothetical protein
MGILLVSSCSTADNYPQTGAGIGWYVDDLSMNDTSEVTEVISSPVTASPSFDFTPPAEGSYILQGRALLYGRYPLEWGPVFKVSATGPATLYPAAIPAYGVPPAGPRP